jgi:hypothetical protein
MHMCTVAGQHSLLEWAHVTGEASVSWALACIQYCTPTVAMLMRKTSQIWLLNALSLLPVSSLPMLTAIRSELSVYTARARSACLQHDCAYLVNAVVWQVNQLHACGDGIGCACSPARLGHSCCGPAASRQRCLPSSFAATGPVPPEHMLGAQLSSCGTCRALARIMAWMD